MRLIHPILWRSFVVVVAAVALASTVSACGSSSGSSSASSAPEPVEAAPTASAGEEPEGAEAAEEPEEGEASEEAEAELAGIMRLQIFGKFGGTKNEFDVAGGTCKIVKINTSPAAVKAGGEAVLDHEKNASVLVAPAKGKATAAECRKAVETAIG